MAKRNHKMALTRDEQGQISIFFSASLVVLVSIVAFVINVGLFVKAKINLQNATDAAAFAGAAVQARQLSKIAHLNWEMRNIYKEFLYKYYVVGNLNIDDVTDVEPGTLGNPMNFRMLPDREAISGRTTHDPYNFPSVCIHLENSKTNICRRYAIPGLPEFGSSNLPGAEEASRAFQDALISTKVNDCVERTKLNMYVATTWAYNVLTSSGVTFGNLGPAILAERQGAWPRAIELAMRIRNLEKIVNHPPSDKSTCKSPGSEKVDCKQSIDEVSNQPSLGNERLVKAFYSGYRNVGGSYSGDEMKNSFTITELKPGSFKDPSDRSASNLLVPAEKTYEKYYLDLKLMMVNYAIFYSAMIPRGDDRTSGACDVSKAAIPIPGYPLGFYKNPDFVTYYAVKGEAEFTGMFNPFGESVKLTTYAAAKPMGGRIGPMLFTQQKGQDGIFGRTDKMRSVPYIAGISVEGTTQRFPEGSSWVARAAGLGDFAPGMPLPVNGATPATKFWIDSPGSAVGGKITSGAGVQFGLPNLVYDYYKQYSTEGYTYDTADVKIIETKNPQENDDPMMAIGLYSKDQFARFRGDVVRGGTVTAEQLKSEVARVRAPTTYEAANYLIPVPFEKYADTDLGHFGQISGRGTDMGNGVTQYVNYIYAPLYGENSIYGGSGEVIKALREFMVHQSSGIRKYIDAMNLAAEKIHKMGDLVTAGAANSRQGYENAAQGVSDIDFSSGSIAGQNPRTCKSLAGTFLYFYYGGEFGPPPPELQLPGPPPPPTAANPNASGVCPKPLGDLLASYFSGTGGDDPDFRKTHYRMEYSYRPSLFDASEIPGGMGIFSAYVPGPFTGVDMRGIFSNLAGSPLIETMRRNFYSTKLVRLKSLKAGAEYDEGASNFNTMSEGNVNRMNPELNQSEFRNPLEIPPEAGLIEH